MSPSPSDEALFRRQRAPFVHNAGVILESGVVLFELSRVALATTQAGLGRMLGVSRRTAQRWSGQGVPSYYVPALVRLVHPRDAALADRIATAGGTTLQALGLTPAAAPAAQAVADGVVDAVVCAAAEAMDLTPRDVRVGLHAVFARAIDIGVSIDFVERVLRASLRPTRQAPATEAHAPPEETPVRPAAAKGRKSKNP